MYETINIVVLILSGWLLTVVGADIEITTPLERLPEARIDDYRLGPGDVISITVDSMDEISLQYAISETGNIVFPTLLAPMKAQGITLEQLRTRLIELLTEYMYEPRVTVDILEFHSHKVLVLGSFQKPGKYELKSERTSLLDIIMEAGGVTELRESDELVILRNPSLSDLVADNPGRDSLLELMKPIRIDLQALLRDGDLTQNVMVQTGDVIYLTSFFTNEQYVYVASGGRGAGAILYEPELTAFKALLRAGVVPDNPQALELIIIRGQHASGEKFITTQLRFDPAHPGEGDVDLFPEDIVILPEASSQVVYVTGEVAKPGALPFQEGLTVLQAILDAGGMSKEAVGTKVKILREDAQGRKQMPVDMDAVLEKGDKAQNIDLMLGDIVVVPGMSLQADIMVTGKVSTAGMVPYEEGMTAIKAIFLAGGLSDKALRSQVRILRSDGAVRPPVLVDISEGQIDAAGNSNPALEPGDLMVVMGAAPGNIVSVLGKVRKPGIIDYEHGLTALQAILKAGGFDRGASRSKVRIVRGEGEQQQKIRANLDNLDKGDRSGADIALLSGDIVIVPETFF
ncbi:SLBB domain-containing protein [Candidatus Poribacteria bacterium]